MALYFCLSPNSIHCYTFNRWKCFDFIQLCLFKCHGNELEILSLPRPFPLGLPFARSLPLLRWMPNSECIAGIPSQVNGHHIVAFNSINFFIFIIYISWALSIVCSHACASHIKSIRTHTHIVSSLLNGAHLRRVALVPCTTRSTFQFNSCVSANCALNAIESKSMRRVVKLNLKQNTIERQKSKIHKTLIVFELGVEWSIATGIRV